MATTAWLSYKQNQVFMNERLTCQTSSTFSNVLSQIQHRDISYDHINYVLINGPFNLHLSHFQHKNQYFFIVIVEVDGTHDRRFLIVTDGFRPKPHHRSWLLGKFMFVIKLKVSYRFFLSCRV
jgi:hypothetical protein